MNANYFGQERRRLPRDSGHVFGTVFVRTNGAWTAREALVLDTNNETVRIRTLPNLKDCDFRLQLDGAPDLFAAEVQRADRRGDSWEFTLQLGPALDRDTLEGLRVLYDFPCEAAIV